MRKHGTTVILVMVLLAGITLLLYPSVSNYWNLLHQSRAIASYQSDLSKIDNSKTEAMLQRAARYNDSLFQKRERFVLSPEETEEYDSLLHIDASGIMGFIEIPAIKETLAVYHGTSEAVLQTGVGHMAGSSLPIGGMGTHSVLTGHRGLPSARLFTDLNKLVVGDRFTVTVLDHAATYEVDQIHIVLPEQMEDLKLDPGKDYCTLVTCTPYGVNTHRILVRGYRVEGDENPLAVMVRTDARQLDPMLTAPLFALPLLFVLLLLLLLKGRGRRGKQYNEKSTETAQESGCNNAEGR